MNPRPPHPRSYQRTTHAPITPIHSHQTFKQASQPHKRTPASALQVKRRAVCFQ
ncbi:hypothetical protein CC78DRAFT_529813 [Lojkania enalia]|uniref:Uncharacterized protein n=1 Tax=Lojkania enalia TaxID=147567 RepID=A0A9P4N993_9PLEO|nr:hypothetical protein CC78DRAFT_529813 [Didymosphaeria enalia]